MQILYLKQILILNFTCRDSCQEVVSLLYGHVIVVLTLVMPILGLQSHIDQTYAELFYIYLLLCSILYLIFVQIDLMYLKWVPHLKKPNIEIIFDINFLKRTRQAVLNHRRKKSLLTVKESMGDSGRSSKTSSSCATGAGAPGGRRNKGNGQQLLPATPSDLLHDESITLFSSVPCEQYGSFYLRLGTVCKLITRSEIYTDFREWKVDLFKEDYWGGGDNGYCVNS